MNILSVSVLILSLSVCACVVMGILHVLKKSKITHGVSVLTTTGNDERITFNVNFVEGEDIQAQYRKLNQVCQLADRRREESFARYQAKLEEEMAKQKELKA